ncbi:hypothetical protein BVRB_6g142660 [Beta vulgaris subsp. vulgaris]|uniref:SCP domain-containing protein n=1 Tax=Beta vulgaris subsp. vulgaris TaxID=3555 RepID=A0A0J8C3V0_BETVV|nr:hypothetical protein BVRB_6g142660 [Beta vulgaris subsp. vulgaris]
MKSGGPYAENTAGGYGEFRIIDAVSQWVQQKENYDQQSNVCKNGKESQSLDSGLLLTSSTNGVIINDVHKPDNKSSSIATTGQGKGKGKMIVAQSLCSDDSSDDDAVPLFTRVSPPPVPLMGKIGGDIGPVSPPKAPSAIQVLCASDLFDENKFLALTSPEVPTLADFCYNEDDTGIFCIEDQDDNSLAPSFLKSHAEDDQKQFLEAHNTARAQVGVAPLAWNQTLAAFAQQFADKVKEKCDNTMKSGGPYGENTAGGYGAFRITDAVSQWVQQKENYDQQSNVWVILNDVHKPANKSSSVATTVQGKGKGKMIVAQSLCSDDSSDDEVVPLFTRVSPPPVPLMGKIGDDTGPVSPSKAPSAIQVLHASDLFDENKFLALTSPEVPTLADLCYNEDDTGTFCIEDEDDNSLGNPSEGSIDVILRFHRIRMGNTKIREAIGEDYRKKQKR